MKKAIITIGSIVFLGIVVILFMFLTDSGPFNKIAINEEVSFSANVVELVDVKTDVGNVHVKTHQSDEFLVSFTGQTKSLDRRKLQLTAEVDGDTLVVRGKQPANRSIFNIRPTTYEVEVLVPESEFTELSIRSDVAEISIVDANVGKMELYSAVGNIDVKSIANDAEIITDVGDITLDLVMIYADIKAHSSVGDINVLFEELPDELQYTVETEVGRRQYDVLKNIPQSDQAPTLMLKTEVGSISVTNE
ncbi:DUF4097 family beta strand repeat-containing protein [Bacillus sp. JCM 19041]|uniref:DUF4097 family beta strand repeat-containing protein n=1 Tax=Bacillus sp. JCM 19041 TaxID=1460637 RepID=UPI0006CF3468